MRRHTSSILLGILILQILFSAPHALCDAEYTPQELSINVYSDGIADLKYNVVIDPTLLSINVSLVGDTYENMLVRDQDNILLDYWLYEGFAKIDVIGSQSIEIEYTASDLTNKTGSLWMLNLEAPVNVNIQLPKRATIISFEPTPIGISFLEDAVSLTMPTGYVEISYVLGVVGTKEHALALINEAEAIIDEMKFEGINVSVAVEILSLAKNAYNAGQYMQSEQYTEQARNQAAETMDLAKEAELAGEAALFSIGIAEDAGRTSLLEQAREELLMAQEYYASGNYQESKQLAEQSAATALNSEKPFLNINMYLIGTIGVGIISSLFFISRKPEKSQNKEIYQMDLEKVFSQHSHLRVDEKEILKFISESKEGVFVSELRQRFHIPKSTAWRMMRRLEGEGIIQTKPIGRETFVQMNPRYR
jgi:uncharacterized membrane protein